jgi:hypothetical protein
MNNIMNKISLRICEKYYQTKWHLSLDCLAWRTSLAKVFIDIYLEKMIENMQK